LFGALYVKWILAFSHKSDYQTGHNRLSNQHLSATPAGLLHPHCMHGSTWFIGYNIHEKHSLIISLRGRVCY